MRNYLILKAESAAFRADPDVHEALRAARVDELAISTLGAQGTVEDLRNAPFDADVAAARGAGFEHLDQLALEHLYGTR